MKQIQSVSCMSVLLVLFLSVGTVFAFPPGGAEGDCCGKEPRWEQHKERMREKLNLSPEEEAALEAFRKEHRAQAKEYHRNIKSTREELKNELEEETLNMDRVNALHATLKDLQGKMEDHRLEGVLKVREILSPDQFSQFLEMMGKHRHGMGGHHDGPPGPPEE